MSTTPSSAARYEARWSTYRSRCDAAIEGGERDLRRVLKQVWDADADEIRFNDRFCAHYDAVGIPRDESGKSVESLSVRNGVYRRMPRDEVRTNALPTIIDHVVANVATTECIVELGSGYGRNLFPLHAAVKERAGVSLEYHACEFTHAGRDLTRKLHGLADTMELFVHAFDYREPDLSFLNNRSNVLFMTVHSIEQIPVLDRSVFEEMLTRAPGCKCLHFEPVGWQHDPQAFRLRHGESDSPGPETRPPAQASARSG